MAWVILVVAGLLEVAWAIGLKYTQGFTKLWPSVLTIVAMAYFDMDIYSPTKEALKHIKPRLHKGSILVFDELCCDAFPGETQAVLEELDLANVRLRRYAHQPYCSYAVVE